MLIFCDTCGESITVNAYDDDPPRAGWARHKPRCAPALDSWRCPQCQLHFPETARRRTAASRAPVAAASRAPAAGTSAMAAGRF